jgi:hypothetical protein
MCSGDEKHVEFLCDFLQGGNWRWCSYGVSCPKNQQKPNDRRFNQNQYYDRDQSGFLRIIPEKRGNADFSNGG